MVVVDLLYFGIDFSLSFLSHLKSLDKTKSANISYNNVCKYIIKAQISVTTMFANMASQKVQEMVILAEQGSSLFRLDRVPVSVSE